MRKKSSVVTSVNSVLALNRLEVCNQSDLFYFFLLFFCLMLLLLLFFKLFEHKCIEKNKLHKKVSQPAGFFWTLTVLATQPPWHPQGNTFVFLGKSAKLEQHVASLYTNIEFHVFPP